MGFNSGAGCCAEKKGRSLPDKGVANAHALVCHGDQCVLEIVTGKLSRNSLKDRVRRRKALVAKAQPDDAAVMNGRKCPKVHEVGMVRVSGRTQTASALVESGS